MNHNEQIPSRSDAVSDRSPLAHAAPERGADRDNVLVLKNTAYLGIAEVLTVPISVLLNALLGRFLGPTNLGYVFLATTVCAAAAPFVNFGHVGPLPAAVAQDRSSAGRLLGTSLAWRAGASVVVAGLVAAYAAIAELSEEQRWAVALVYLTTTFINLTAACQETIRGFERTDISAYQRVGSQILAVIVVMPVLVAGGSLRGTLLAQAFAAFVMLVLVLRATRKVGVSRLEVSTTDLRMLTREGAPFLVLAVVLVLQPNIDAYFLAKLAPSVVVGWYAVAQRLIGFLLIPATALVGSLYPTLCRLRATDQSAFGRIVRESIELVAMVVIPVAVGCGLYPEIGVVIFGRDTYQPAEQTLRLFSVYLLLVYFSMPIASALSAAGRQRAWTAVQLLCVANSLLLDPMLIRHFQRTTGNGATGLPVAAAISEALMVIAGLVLLPKGVLQRSMLKPLGRIIAAGCIMLIVAFGLRKLTTVAFVAAPLAGSGYLLALYWLGAIKLEQLLALRGFVGARLARLAR